MARTCAAARATGSKLGIVTAGGDERGPLKRAGAQPRFEFGEAFGDLGKTRCLRRSPLKRVQYVLHLLLFFGARFGAEVEELLAIADRNAHENLRRYLGGLIKAFAR